MLILFLLLIALTGGISKKDGCILVLILLAVIALLIGIVYVMGLHDVLWFIAIVGTFVFLL